MGNSIKPQLEHAEKTGACNLANKNLTEYPEPLRRLFKNLRTLDLSENKIPSVPSYIGSYTMMKSLNLGSNRLGNLPNDIGGLKKLETLIISNNRMTSLPPTLSKLASLRDINASGNFLKDFPTQLCGLKQLNSIDVSSNKITEVPDDVRGIEAIEINLNRNQLSKLSEAVTECPRLKVLRLEENCLDLVAFTPKIMVESQISTLAVEGNIFEMKAFHQLEGYDHYMERYTATKKKFT